MMVVSYKETCGIIVWCKPSLLKSRIWLFNDFIEQDIEGITCKLGDWFLCIQNKDKWDYKLIEPKLETRVNDWKVEIKVPVIMCRHLVSDIGIKSNTKMDKILFSPVVGRVGLFLSSDKYVDGIIYEVWVTNVPDEQEKCKILKEMLKICWMIGLQDPILFNENVNDYNQISCNNFNFCEGIVLKLICSTMIIIGNEIGLCFSSQNKNIKRGDKIYFIKNLVSLYDNTNFILAGNCSTIKENYIDFVNEFDNEFFSLLNVTKECFEKNEYYLTPYIKVKDSNKIIDKNLINLCVKVVIRFRINLEMFSIEFYIKNIVKQIQNQHQQELFLLNLKNEEINKSSILNDKKIKPIIQKHTTPNRIRNDFGDIDLAIQESSKQESIASNTMYNLLSDFNNKNKTTNNSYLSKNNEIKSDNNNQKVSDCYVGIIAAQTVEAYYVYSPLHSRDVYLPKYLKDFQVLGKPINLGQWINFKTISSNGSKIGVTSFNLINPLFPTMPSFNTIMIECRINIPHDYDANQNNNTVKSEFVPTVADQDILIRKCHFGKTLLAVMRRTKTNILDVNWNLEYIKF